MSSTPRDPAVYIWDARRAAERIVEFVTGRTWDDYQTDAMLRSAVERQFEIIGEALNRLSRSDASTASRIDDLPRIVSFRNMLIHGYATVDDRIVWDITTQLPPLIDTLTALLNDR